MKGTLSNNLTPIDNCLIEIPGYGIIPLNNLPDISDSKSAAYNDEPIIGRSFPLKTYSHSENRVISMSLHFFTLTEADITKNMEYLRAIQSAVYPRSATNGAPFLPPPVCTLICGELLGVSGVCAILKSYNVKFPPDVVWYEPSFIPLKFDIETSWEVVYKSSDLPGQSRIITDGA